MTGVQTCALPIFQSELTYLSYIVDLEPYTDHTYILEACTAAACTNSSEVAVTTLQSLPQGKSPTVYGCYSQDLSAIITLCLYNLDVHLEGCFYYV